MVSFDIDFEKKQDIMETKNYIHKIKEQRKVGIIPNIEDPKEANKKQILYQCPNCGIKFKREEYAKEVPICGRAFQGEKNRKSKN
jgi:rubrerythrin